MADECKGQGGALLMSFFAGAVIGGGLALLMAPRSGEETRETLKVAGDEARERLRTMMDEAEQRLREPLDEIQTMLKEKKEVFVAAVEAGKLAAQEEAQRQTKM